MFLCARSVRHDDVETMLGLFLPASRHGAEAREKERERWRRLWSAGLPQGVVMEDFARPPGDQAVGMMVAGPVFPKLHDRLVASGEAPLLDGLADAVESGEAPPMTEENLGRANADDGIDLIVFWLGYGDELRSFEAGASLRSRTVRAFQDLNAGNRLRRFTFEIADPVVALRFKAYGLEPLRQEGGAAVLSLHRDAALTSNDLSSQRFFSYDPPILGFSAAQRAILLLARQGFTDQEIAAALDKTTDSVKKRWAGIYTRFAHAFPGRLPNGRDGSRGTEKRRNLLTYLRDRPEELRPYGEV